MHGRAFQCLYSLGSTINVAPDIQAQIVSVTFNISGAAIYNCEWFNNGVPASSTFFEEQLAPLN